MKLERITQMDKLELIEKSFFFTDEEMSKLLKIDKRKYIDYKNGEENESITKTIDTIFTEEKKNLHIILKYPLNKDKYDSALSVYSKVLKEFFCKKEKIYVLSKIKKENTFKSIFNLFFNNTKEAVLKDMNHFSPSYLVISKDKKVLVTIREWTLIVVSLPKDTDTLKFKVGNFVYKRANEINV